MPNRILVLAATGVFGALAACATPGQPGGRGAAAGGDAPAPAAAQAAVFNELFRANASALKESAAAYCISTGPDRDGGQADPAVLAALRDNPKVKPRAACEVDQGGKGVFDRQTRQPALLFNVETASCQSATDCLIHGGYYEGNLSAQRNRYRARLVNGTWAVSMDEMGPVS